MAGQDENALVLAAKVALAKAIASGSRPNLPAAMRKKLESRPAAQAEITSWLREILEEFAINEYTVAAKLAEGLQATKPVVTDAGVLEYPDYFTQHKYLDTAARLLNLYPPTRQQLQTDSNGIIVRLTPALGFDTDAEDGERVILIEGEANEPADNDQEG